MSIRQRLIRLFWEYDTEPIEGLTGLTAAGLGALLLLPVNSYSTGQVWLIFQGHVSEAALGVFFLTVGALELIGLTWGGRAWRRNAARALFLVWTFFTIMFFDSSPPATNGAYTLFLALYTGWAAIRLRGEDA